MISRYGILLLVGTTVLFTGSALGVELLVSGGTGFGGSRSVTRWDGVTGAPQGVFAVLPQNDVPLGLTLGPGGDVYVAGALTDSIYRYDSSGTFLGVFATGGGLDGPQGITFGPDGNLYVSSSLTDSVLRYDGSTGAFIDTFASGGGMQFPDDLEFGPDGDLYVGGFGLGNEAFVYDGATGSFDRSMFVGGIGFEIGLAFEPGGKLLATDGQTASAFDTVSGIPDFSIPPPNWPTPQFPIPQGLWDIDMGPDGAAYLVDSDLHDVWRWDLSTGDATRFISTSGLVLNGPSYMLFVPEPTSAFLLLVGSALLARRHRRRV
ncbi:MAG: PEP-CTERM sorting domain-containing protein [Phycisphaerae bacterium]